MTTPKDETDDNLSKISSGDLDRFFQGIFGKSLPELAEDLRQMNDEEREEMRRSMENNYVAVSDPENYPPEVVKVFEERTMVPTRLVAERMRRQRDQNSGEGQ
jgi:hypothetical protein